MFPPSEIAVCYARIHTTQLHYYSAERQEYSTHAVPREVTRNRRGSLL
jgi:hypothetical protein